jgi:hypothetical protein
VKNRLLKAIDAAPTALGFPLEKRRAAEQAPGIARPAEDPRKVL